MEYKLIIFDLDGVLIDTRELHFEVLNESLKEVSSDYVISHKDHLTKFDGLSTRKKLEILSDERGLPIRYHETIWERKQQLTFKRLKTYLKYDKKIVNIIKKLKQDGLKICVASNSIRETIKISLMKIGVMEYVDYFISNEDVSSPKPHPEIYMHCMIKEKVLPKETLIIEDSYIGRTSAIQSGGVLCPVKNPKEVTLERIYKSMEKEIKDPKWGDDKMNILIPMAGAGSRFANVGYTFPKPLIQVGDKPMIQTVTENLNVDANYIFLVRTEHYEKYNLKSFLNAITPNCEIVLVDELTEGACCTTLLAEKYINNDNPLLIANSDQFMEWSSGEFYHSVNSPGIDGSIITFNNNHPKWSYVKCDDYGNVTELKEKEVISNDATVGIYYWAKGSDYVKYSHQMIEKGLRVNGEFYVAPVYNEAIENGKVIKTYKIDKMWGLGTPEDLKYYLKNKMK
jgi:HAD superfamily hydrolase (TIGR01509 family)